MSNRRGDLGVHAFATPLASDDGRLLAAVQGLEQACPGIRLEWEISPEGRPILLARRDEWLAAAASRGSFPLLCNGDETSLVTISGRAIPAGVAPGRQPLLDIYAELPLDARVVAVAEDVLEGVADGARAL